MVILTTPAKILAEIRKGMPVPSSGQTLIFKSVAANTSYQTLHTVTAGKTFYLMGITASYQVGDVTRWKLSFDNGSTVHFAVQQDTTVSLEKTNLTISTGWPLAQVASEEIIRVKADVSNTEIFFNIWGWEE